MARIVELRIHGVSGTPPEEMLQAALVRQVAGDDQTRFFRAVNGDGQEQHPSADHLLEAYNWGQLTSGTWKKALWLLLIPFGVLNAAHFMLSRSASPSGRAARIVAEAALRALGLVLTVALTLAFAEAAVDLVAWQWSGLSGHDLIGRAPDPRGFLVGTMLGCAAMVPALLWFGGREYSAASKDRAPVSGSSIARNSELTAPEFEVGDPDTPTLRLLHLAASWSVLAILGFSVLRNHGNAADRSGLSVLGHGWSASWALLGALLVLTVAIGNPQHPEGRMRSTILRALGILAAAAALALLVGGMVAVRAAVSIPTGQRGVLPGISDITFNTMLVALLALALLGLASAVLAATSRQGGVPSAFRRYLWGMTGPVLASVGIFLGVGFGAALAYSVRWVLGRFTGNLSNLHLPVLHARIAHAWGLTVLLSAVLALITVLLWWLQRNRFRVAVRQAHNTDPYPAGAAGVAHPTDLSPTDVARVATAWWTARIKLHVQIVFAVFAIFGFVLTVLTVLSSMFDRVAAEGSTVPPSCADDRGPATVEILRWTVGCRVAGGGVLIAIGSITLLLLALGLVYLGRRSLADSRARRSANVVWDVIAFWPRVAHPLVPPPYTARAMDQLRRRIYFYLGLCADPALHADNVCNCERSADPVDRVVLAAHSQGSLLAVASLVGLRLTLPDNESDLTRGPSSVPADGVRLDQLALLTFGSQLQVAYSRAFPAYVNADFLASLIEAFNPPEPANTTASGSPGWISLMRETDPIGGQVFSWNRSAADPARSWRWPELVPQPGADEVLQPSGVRRCGYEWRLLDPVPSDGETGPKQKILGHSGYFVDPAWAEAVKMLTPRRSTVGAG